MIIVLVFFCFFAGVLGGALIINCEKVIGYNTVIVSTQEVSVTLKDYIRYFRSMFVMDTEMPVYSNNLKFQEAMIKELLLAMYFYENADDAAKKQAFQDAAADLAKRKNFMESESVGSFEQLLKEKKITQKEVLDSLAYQHIIKLTLKNKITEEMIKDRYINDLKADKDTYTIATVRSILIAMHPNGKEPRSEEETLRIAEEVYSRLKNGEDFAALAKLYTDEEELKESGGFLGEISIASWFPELKNTVSELEENEFSAPLNQVLVTFCSKLKKRM